MTPPRNSYLLIFIAFIFGVIIADFVLAMIHPEFTDTFPPPQNPIIPVIGDVVIWVVCIGVAAMEYRRQSRLIRSYFLALGDTTRCTQCEYDLTGNMSGICPECGSRIERLTSDLDRQELR